MKINISEKQAAEYIEMADAANDGCGYEWVGVRVCDEVYNVGQTVRNSREWCDGEVCVDDETGEDIVMDGACALDIRRATAGSHEYCGTHAYVIAGNYGLYGDDPGEIIIRNAVVIAVIA